MNDDIPTSRYLNPYTPDNPPPVGHVRWLDVAPDDLIILGTHVVGREDTGD